MFGGGQEQNIRSGTLNVPGIVGFGKAIEIARKDMESENERLRKWTGMMLSKFENLWGCVQQLVQHLYEKRHHFREQSSQSQQCQQLFQSHYLQP